MKIPMSAIKSSEPKGGKGSKKGGKLKMGFLKGKKNDGEKE